MSDTAIHPRRCFCDKQDSCVKCRLFHADPRYHKLWGGTDPAILSLPVPDKPRRARKAEGSIPACGPGTELKMLLAELGLAEKAGCGCGRVVVQMNRWGVAGCREHREEIAGWLKKSATKSGWMETVKAGAAMLRQDWFDPVHPLLSLVDEAIRRAGTTHCDQGELPSA